MIPEHAGTELEHVTVDKPKVDTPGQAGTGAGEGSINSISLFLFRSSKTCNRSGGLTGTGSCQPCPRPRSHLSPDVFTVHLDS